MRALVAPIVAGLAPILIFAILLIGPSLGLVKWQPPILWTSQFGTSGAEVSNSMTEVSADSSGLYTAGFVGYPSAIVNPSSSYLFVSKYDYTGRQVWARQFARADDQIVGTGVEGDGVYVAARVNDTYLVRKYDLNGNVLWASQVGKLSDGISVTSISAGPTGVYVGDTADTNQGTALTVKKYDSTGNMVWTKTVGNGTGGFVVYSGPSGVYTATSQYVNGPDSHTIVSKFDANGTLEWTRSFDGPPAFICNCKPTSISGDVSSLYVAGSAIESLFVRSYDWSGNLLWTAQAPAPDYSGVATLHMSANPSGVYLAGTTGHANGYVIRYDGNGNQVWLILVHQLPAAISVGENAVYVGGTNGYAFIEELSQSSSLILFGVNPPFSFGLAALLGGIVLLSLIWLRRRWRKKIRPPSTVKMTQGSHRSF